MSSRNCIFVFVILLGCILNTTAHAQKVFYSKKVTAWDEVTPNPKDEILHSVFLIGDLKYPNKDNKVLQLLEQQMQQAGKNSSVFVLGDIVYPLGMPDSSNVYYKESLAKHDFLFSKFKSYEGQLFFIPGNHDWAKGHKNGWQHILAQEKHIESKLNRGNVYLPDGGQSGPVEIHLTDELVMIVFDMQWWLHKYERPELGEMGFEKAEDFYTALEDILKRNQHKTIMLSSHHPLFSVGYHGGYFPTKNSIFPLLEVKKWLYIPLPGFIYTGYRKIFGHPQDIAHPNYKEVKNKLWDILIKYPNTIYTAGHEHNLQYLQKGGIHHIVSGGGGEGTYISKRPRKADFAASSEGFCRVDNYKNGDVWATFFKPTDSEPIVLFRTKLFSKKFAKGVKAIETEIDTSTNMIKTNLSDQYQSTSFKKFFMGELYRQEWGTEVNLPIFDIGAEHGGLEIIKRGGGQQTLSLRLKDKKGNQFVLRSVNKSVKKTLDKVVHNTLIEDMIQDEISASHPYAALAVPKMADAIGLYHTNPKLVYIPDDPRFGIYRKDVANQVFLYEERPHGNQSKADHFGNSKKVIGSLDLIKKLKNNQNHFVDQRAVVRARLFDILIGDWDRHEDQWRWASFKEGDKTLYKPIPRDRDQVFFISQGLIMWLISRDFLMPRFQGFNHKIKNVEGFQFNARHFDRTYISEMTTQDWVNEAKQLQLQLTDSIIKEAINSLPPEIYALNGLAIESKLKSRLNDLTHYAEAYSRYLSESVDVIGTHERDFFDIIRLANGDLKVSVYKLTDKKGRIKDLRYTRLFKSGETKEVRLYGLKEKDRFEVYGDSKKGIKLRMIGGKGEDYYYDQSNVIGISKQNIIYDRRDKKNEFNTGIESNLELGTHKDINEFNRFQHKYNSTIPIVSFGYNLDDGIFVSVGAHLKRYNFRDSSIVNLKVKHAFKSQATGFEYHGIHTGISRHFDLSLDIDLGIPRNVDNYFGLGNQTTKLEYADNEDDEQEEIEKKYYRVNYRHLLVNPMLLIRKERKISFALGSFYQFINLTDTTNRFIGSQYPDHLDENVFQNNSYLGFNAKINIDTRNNKVNPERGIHWLNEAAFYADLNKRNKSFLRLKTDLSTYISFTTHPNFIIALRFGGAANIGDYDFYHANYLGGKNNLRGFFSNRFGGDKYVYQNTELRIKLLNIRKYLFVGQWGILLYNDIGKVWVKGQKTQNWHNGYGIGTWLNPFNATTLNFTYQKSKEEGLFIFSMNFLF